MTEQMPHLKLTAAQAAPYALLPGDPARVDRITRFLDSWEPLACNREFKSIKGVYRNVPVMAVSTGIGGASAAIAVEELSRIGVKGVIRIGSCGALQAHMKLGDLILVNGAVRDDGASRTYIDPIFPAIPDTGLLMACEAYARAAAIPYHIGIARSHDSFYTDREEAIDRYWSGRGVLGADMETAAIFVTAALRGVKAASILNTVVEYEGSLEEEINRYSDGETAMAAGEENEILTALEALVWIDKNQGGNLK